jgi:hypothetical protein
MAIRLRRVEGVLVALCAAETDAVDGDVYLDDGQHYALAMKFRDDYGLGGDIRYAELAATQRLRDAETELLAWIAATRTPESAVEDG